MPNDNIKAALKKYFGYDSFRPLQEEIIQNILGGQDTVVLMPTGSGKSICYQIPSLIMPGVTLVVSPLISLMRDQVEALKANGVSAAYLNSSLSYAKQKTIESSILEGKIKLVYVSPEKLLSNGFLSFIKDLKIELFAIDEAHCISEWGHDFRPEYAQLNVLKEKFPKIPIVALTATADRATRKDIIIQLKLDEPEVFISSFDRPNLSLTVLPGRKKFEIILDFIRKRPNQSGIIYCLSRKNTESLSDKLNNYGINAAFYHAGMDAEKRSMIQDDFIKDKIPIICATIAFGMGIDKSNVRWIIHHNLPKNIESYYQEIGRAGRDGLKSDTLLFYSFSDVMKLRGLIEGNDNSKIQLIKLQRMKEYAEAVICRRKILLNYFSENIEENCNNCDVCKSPPVYFDGTIIVQKALSALSRLKEKVGSGLLIDILRGSSRQEIFYNGYHEIKTYGAGKDISYRDWQEYILQMLHFGFIEFAYDEGNVLKLTSLSKQILFDKKKVYLVQIESIKKRSEDFSKSVKPKTKRQRIRDDLFETLRKLRRSIADEKNVPPYIVFSDASLEEMAAERPIDELAMKGISGVGHQKFEMYGKLFINEIIQFIQSKANSGEIIQGSTHLT